jgi:hypothetical protein
MEPLILQKKTEVLLNKEVYPMLLNFPKAEKFCICQEIKQAFYRIIRNAMLSNNMRKDRLYYLNQVDVDLKLLLVLFSISREQKYITEKRSLYLQEKICELGRITGGLMKSAR